MVTLLLPLIAVVLTTILPLLVSNVTAPALRLIPPVNVKVAAALVAWIVPPAVPPIVIASLVLTLLPL